MKKLIILMCFLIAGCGNDVVIVQKDTYEKQIKKCYNNDGVKNIAFIVDRSGNKNAYYKIRTECNNSAFFTEFYSDNKK